MEIIKLLNNICGNTAIKTFVALLIIIFPYIKTASKQTVKPRILISTDIGGTDPDDNQSMIHLMMYSDRFDIEGLISSPSFGNGSKEEILRMIDIYAKDYPRLKKKCKGLLSPDSLKRLCRQGRRGRAPFAGYGKPTEGSMKIVECGRRNDPRPLWVLVWGGLEDVAQALHDAPEIQENIRIYWIGGPNKKWSVNSYLYIARNFPGLWFIENNATYRGFINSGNGKEYFIENMKGHGAMGDDFGNYYDGNIKMGDSPSLFYIMHGDTDSPRTDSWGGRFEQLTSSPLTVTQHPMSENDTVAVYSVVEIVFEGPETNAPAGTPCFKAEIDKQIWDGYYLGNNKYTVRYAPKAPAVLTYKTTSGIDALNNLKGSFVVSGKTTMRHGKDAIKLGNNWYTDVAAPEFFIGKWQGAATQAKWNEAILADWAGRWAWLR